MTSVRTHAVPSLLHELMPTDRNKDVLGGEGNIRENTVLFSLQQARLVTETSGDTELHLGGP